MYKNDKTLKMLKIVSDIAKIFDSALIAEGVETKEQLNQLKEFGYQVIQGYYFSKPLTNKEFEDLLGGEK
jgi:EAL domain-containing protein (putative c-di-GMP-specific phosphodiesterase class I)